APGPEPGVVAVDLAALRVAAGRLEVAERVGADPDVLPGRRNRERPDPLQRLAAGDPPSVGVDVGEAPAGAAAIDAGLRIGRVAETSARLGLVGHARRIAVGHWRES